MVVQFSKTQTRGWSLVIAILLVLQTLAGVAWTGTAQAEGTVVADTFVDQPGGKTKWYVAGSFQGWNNTNPETQLKHLVGDFYALSLVLPAGNHEFKLVKNGTWDGYSNNGGNFQFTLAEESKVNFYINDALGQARINLPNVAGLTQFVPAAHAAGDKAPRLVGSVQPVFGEAEWSPSEAKQFFVDYNFDGTVYKLQRSMPAGTYEAKVTFGPNWDVNFGDANGNNVPLNTLDPADVTFTVEYDVASNKGVLTHNYVPADGQFDGQINRTGLYFDSRSVTYKKPFGAVAEGSKDVTFRIAANQGDVQVARLELQNGTGVSSAFDMHIATRLDGKDFWEVTVPKDKFVGIGIWGYKFILIDGSAKVEYGDDGLRGGTGTSADEGVVPFELTVYAADYKTPDWMKNGVVYQIFPDRFFDGNKDNNRAKTLDGYRGTTAADADLTAKGGYKYQYYDGGVPSDPTPEQVYGTWADVPENPNRSTPENKPYYPGAKTDGQWTNEFYGGDLQGIQAKLDYLKSIGVSVLYLNPVAWAASNHKYDATDYKHLDPMFGQPVYNTPGDPTSGLNYDETRKASDQVFNDFAKAARAKGFHLIVDGVFNHVGDDSIYFDRYEKYPEIGAYEYWAKVWNKVNDEALSQADAEAAVRASYTSIVNPATGVNYKYPEDFEFTTWFTVPNEKVSFSDGTWRYKYEAWWGFDSLPAMDAKEPQAGDAQALPGQHEWNNPSYRNHVIGQDLTGKSATEAEAAMQEAASQRWNWMGAHGWRLDVAPDVSQGTWQEFRKSVKSTEGRTDANGETIDEPLILGEEWGVATHYLLGNQFDSVMNYRFREAVQTYIKNGDAASFHNKLEAIREDYPDEAWRVMLNLVDSHDTPRSITIYDHPEYEEEHLKIAPEATDTAIKKQQLTAILQMGYPGSPTVYYGDEVGVAGTRDPDSRRSFPWERVTESNGSYAGVGRYAALFNTYKQAAATRNANDVFRNGDLKIAYAQGDVIAYARKNTTKGALVATNRGANEVTFEANVAGYLPDGMILNDQLGTDASAVVTDGKVALTLQPLSGVMMLSDGTMTVVPVVTNVQASGNNRNVTTTWDAVPGAESYNVYRMPIEGGTIMKVGANLPTTTHTDVNVQNGTKYYYAVTAVIGTSESQLSNTVAATPSFPVNAATITQQATDMTLGVGQQTSEIQVTIDVPGLTDSAEFAGKEAAGLTARLAFYQPGTNPALAADTKLRFKADTNDGKKIYWATFEPTEVGTWHYEARVTTNNGETWTKSAEAAVNVAANTADTTAPTAPALAEITVESNRAALAWTNSDEADRAGYEVYRKEAAGSFTKIATLPKTATSYVDFTVSNDVTYTYTVAAFDKAYNRAQSNERSVKPTLVMVDVTLRVHIPNYTPTGQDVYIAGNFNGWNSSGGKLSIPSGATTREVLEYKFKMMAGKMIEYKYTRGTWDTEAFTSHTRVANDTQDFGNWAYSSTDTNMKLTIKNQGNNQMLVEDYVLRWVDMPMILSMPRITTGENVAYTTDEDKFTLKGVVPYGVAFTINGQPLPAGAMDAHGNVYLENIPLNVGENKFTLHIEPTAETLAQPWYTDQGRKSQATKTLEMVITRTGTGTDPGTGGGGTTPGGETGGNLPPHVISYNESAIRNAVTAATGDTVTLTYQNGTSEMRLPTNVASLLGEKALVIQSQGVSVTLTAADLAELSKKLDQTKLAGAQFVITADRLTQTEMDDTLTKAQAKEKATLQWGSQAFDLQVALVTADGKTAVSLDQAKPGVELRFPVGGVMDKELTGLYLIKDNGQLVYVGGTWEGDVLTAPAAKGGTYAVIQFDKQFTDVKNDHWANKVIKKLTAKQVVNGVSETTYEPERQITRAEFATLLVNTLGLSLEGGAENFSDVNESDWYYAYVQAAAAAGLIYGRGDAQFAPNGLISREEMAALLMRAHQYQQGKTATATSPIFTDGDQISTWAKTSVEAAVNLGFLVGKGQNQFDPRGIATRAESAQVISKILK